MVETLAATAKAANSTQVLAAGYDPGFGQSKLVLSGHREVVIPSYFFEKRYDLHHNIPASLGGGFVRYLSGDRADLAGSSWLGGLPAYLDDPKRYIKNADDPQAKVLYGLQLLLSAIATLPYRPQWNLFLVASVHSVETYGEQLRKALQGRHTVVFGNQQPSIVSIRLGHIYEEGYGVAASRTLATREQSSRVVYDIGSGTIRVLAFGPTGNVIGQPETIPAGVDNLIEAIAKHPAMRALERGQEGDRHLIRIGIEQHTLLYGKQGDSFADIYHDELAKWARAVLVRAVRAGQPYHRNADEVIACGGGANLPDLQPTLKGCGITPITHSAIENAKGLKQLADTMLSRMGG